MKRRISMSAAALLLMLFATAAKADTCFNGQNFDDQGNVTGTCTDTTANTPPPVASTPGNGGIFSCNAPGASSIAASSAIGGTYVPVFDAAVALNTGTLTYKECVLRVLFNQQKQAATVATVNNDWKLLSQGRSGNPQWPVNYSADLGKVSDTAFVNAFQSGVLSTLNPAFQNQVQTALVRNYQITTQAPQNSLACPYSGNWQAVLQQPTQNFSWNAVFAMANPACDPIYAYSLAQNQLNASVAAAQNEWQTRLNWSNGIYDVRDANGNVVVPGTFLNAVGAQALTSGFRQLENANDIGQMVGSFFAGLGSRLLSGPSSVASVQSYLDSAVAQQQNSLANSLVNTALTNLYQILNWEQEYNAAQQQMTVALTTAITQLRGAESKCWSLIIQNVCSASSTPSTTASGAATCTGTNGAQLTIATSTSFSNAVIVKAKIKSVADVLQKRIRTSNSNLATLNTLVTGVQSSDATIRNTALQQLQNITSASPPVIHTQDNVTKAQNELQQVQATMSDAQTGLVTTTIHRWAGELDANGNQPPINPTTGQPTTIAWDGTTTNDVGWCNINQKQTLDNWITAWTK